MLHLCFKFDQILFISFLQAIHKMFLLAKEAELLTWTGSNANTNNWVQGSGSNECCYDHMWVKDGIKQQAKIKKPLWREDDKTVAVKKCRGILWATKAYLSNSIRKNRQLEHCSLDSNGIPLSLSKVHTHTHLLADACKMISQCCVSIVPFQSGSMSGYAAGPPYQGQSLTCEWHSISSSAG